MDMLSVALTEKYHPRYNKWIKNSGSQPALFISTELEEDEINSILTSENYLHNTHCFMVGDVL